MTAQNTPERNQGTSQRARNRESRAQATPSRRSLQNDEQDPSASNLPSDQTAPEQEYSDYLLAYDEDDAALNAKIPDVLLDTPVVKLNDLDFELNELRAKVALFAKVFDLMELSVGIDAFLDKVKLKIESVEVQALLKVRLDNVTRILDRVLTTVDRNPQIVQELLRGPKEALSDISSGAGSAIEDAGERAGEAIEGVGAGAGEAVEDVGGGAGEAVGEVGEGAGQAAQDAMDQAGQTAQGAPGEVQDEVKVTPSAERLAQRLGVSLSTVEGTGVGGRITVRDVRRAAQEG